MAVPLQWRFWPVPVPAVPVPGGSSSRTVPVHAVPVRTVRLWHPVRAVRFSIGSGLPVPVPFTSFMLMLDA